MTDQHTTLNDVRISDLQQTTNVYWNKLESPHSRSHRQLLHKELDKQLTGAKLSHRKGVMSNALWHTDIFGPRSIQPHAKIIVMCFR